MTDRILIIGLDGGTWNVLVPYMEAGLLPNLAGLWRQCYWATLRTTLPPITPVAWASLITGVNPGKHGVFGFGTYRDRQAGYLARPVHRGDIAAPSLWRILSDYDMTNHVVNVPMTYPPEQIRGSIVTGMFTPGFDSQYTWPPELKDELTAAGIRPKFMPDFAEKAYACRWDWLARALEGDASTLLDDLDNYTRRQHRVACYLMRTEWRFFMKVYQATDMIQHYLWPDLLPPPIGTQASPRSRRILRSLQLVDTCVGELLELAGKGTTVMVVSDHGAGPCMGRFAMGRWLSERGYAEFRKSAASGRLRRVVVALGLRQFVRRVLGRSFSDHLSDRTSAMLWNATKAFVDESASGFAVRINAKGQFREGLVEAGEAYERLRHALMKDLEDLVIEDNDLRPIGKTFRREDVYKGPYADLGPDILLAPGDDGTIHAINGYADTPRLQTTPGNAGQHQMEGICMIAGPGVRASGGMCRAEILDVVPTVLARLALPIPDYMDGRVLAEAFEVQPEIAFETRDPQFQLPAVAPDRVYSEEQERAIESALRNLGYMD
jgi:predicted AlkP superfamily phosphohydrolase/phosphomutase